MPKLPSVSELMVGAHLPSVLDRSSNQNHVRHSASSPRSAVSVSPHQRYVEQNTKEHANAAYNSTMAPLPAVPNALPHRSSFSGPVSGNQRPTDYFSPAHHVHLPPPQQLTPQHPGVSQSSSYEQPAQHVESPLHMPSPKQTRASSLSHTIVPPQQYPPQHQLPPQHQQQQPQQLPPSHLPPHHYVYPQHPPGGPPPPNGVYARQEQPLQAPQHMVAPGMIVQGYGHQMAVVPPTNMGIAPYPYNVGLPPLMATPSGAPGYGKHGSPQYGAVPLPSAELGPGEVEQNNALVNKRRIIKRRTRTGCLTCRKRRIKCDERKPHCYNCERSKKLCLGYEVTSSAGKRRNSDNSSTKSEKERDV